MARCIRVKREYTLEEAQSGQATEAAASRSLLSLHIFSWVQKRAGFLSNCPISFLAPPGAVLVCLSPWITPQASPLPLYALLAATAPAIGERNFSSRPFSLPITLAEGCRSPLPNMAVKPCHLFGKDKPSFYRICTVLTTVYIT